MPFERWKGYAVTLRDGTLMGTVWTLRGARRYHQQLNARGSDALLFKSDGIDWVQQLEEADHA